MNTFMTESIYASSSKKGDEVCKKIKRRVEELEQILSTTLPASDVYFINHNSKFPASIKKELSSILDFCGLMYEKTDGLFNPSLYPIIKEWGFTTGEYKVPSENVIQNLLLNIDFEKLNGLAAGSDIPSGMEIDFGAVGKGYAADEALLILEENGIKSALLDFGGNIQALGKKPDGSLWKVGIKNPWGGQVACALSVESKAVVTSGGYERFFEKDGERYIHIFDPTTGHPSQSDLESVTIVCESGKYADALSTALFVMGKDKAIEWWKNQLAEKTLPAFDFILITKSGGLIYSEGLSDFIEPIYQFVSIETVSLN